MAARRSQRPAKRRTTLTLPSESLAAVERLARSRQATVSSIVAELLDEGLRAKQSALRADEVLRNYQEAFGNLTEEELLLVNGIHLTEDVP